MQIKGQVQPEKVFHTLEQEVSYGEIILAIHQGHKTLYAIQNSLKPKTSGSIFRQIKKLEEKKYIVMEKEIGARGAKKYNLNKKELIKYWLIRYPGFNAEKVNAHFEQWLSLFASQMPYILNTKSYSIDMIGHYLKMNSDGLLKNALGLLLGKTQKAAQQTIKQSKIN